jgi:hypothetical protein
VRREAKDDLAQPPAKRRRLAKKAPAAAQAAAAQPRRRRPRVARADARVARAEVKTEAAEEAKKVRKEAAEEAKKVRKKAAGAVLLPVAAGRAAAAGDEKRTPMAAEAPPAAQAAAKALPAAQAVAEKEAEFQTEAVEEFKKAKKAKAKARGKPKAKVPKEASGSSGVLQPVRSGDGPGCLLLQLKRPHYDAIMCGRKQWEARPLCDGSNRAFRQSIFDKLATVGRVAVLQSGFGTNDRMRIIDVRRYRTSFWQGPPAVRTMVVELGVDLLPDEADDNARVKVYESLYGVVRCATGFVAMRFGRLSVASSGGVHPAA